MAGLKTAAVGGARIVAKHRGPMLDDPATEADAEPVPTEAYFSDMFALIDHNLEASERLTQRLLDRQA